MSANTEKYCRRLVWLLIQREAHRHAAGELHAGNTVRAAFDAGLSERDRALLERFDRVVRERANEILSAAWAYSPSEAPGERLH